VFSTLEKKFRLFRSWTSLHPIWCSWQVTYRCNFRCKFCHYWHDPLGQANEPTVADFETGARKIATYGTLMVSLAGGEPLLRTDLPEIVHAIGRYHFPFITTNGWFVTPTVASDLMNAGLWGASVSIDYASAARHDEQRGMDGAWDQAWKAVEILANARTKEHQRINVIAVLLDDNIDQLSAIAEMAAQRGAFFMVQPYGYLKTGTRAYEHNDGPVSPRLLALHQQHRNFLSNPRYLGLFDTFLNGGVPDCRAGRAFFNIDSTGDVAICVERKDKPLGNLYRDPPQNIHRRLRHASKNNTCTACWYNCRGEVESLYKTDGLFKALPTFIFDRGKPETGPRKGAPTT